MPVLPEGGTMPGFWLLVHLLLQLLELLHQLLQVSRSLLMGSLASSSSEGAAA